MPTYRYQEILDDGSDGEVFEIVQSIHEPSLTVDPKTGRAVRRLFLPPNLGIKHTPGSTQTLLDPKNLESKGFTQYQKDPVSGKYHKAFGEKGPDTLKRKLY